MSRRPQPDRTTGVKQPVNTRRWVSWLATPRVRDVVFLVVCLLHWRYRIDLRLLYHGGGVIGHTMFCLDPLFLEDRLTMPGGPQVLLAGYLAQWCYLPWAGPLLLTAIAALLLVVGEQFARAAAGRPVPGFRYLPPLLLVVLYNGFQHRWEFVLGVIPAAALATWYLRLPAERPARRAALLVLALPPLYYLGGGTYLIFAVTAVIAELRHPQRRVLGLLYIVYGEALPWLFQALVWDHALTTVYSKLLPPASLDEPTLFAIPALWLCFPLAGWWLAGRPAGRTWAPGWAWVGLLLTLAGALRLGYDPRIRPLLVWCQANHQEDWAAAAAAAEAIGRADQRVFVGHGYIRALYELGRLPEDLFRIPLNQTCLLFEVDRQSSSVDRVELRLRSYLLTGDLLLRLGFLNEAGHEAMEALEAYGPLPDALFRLARVQALKGRPNAARIFLRALLPVPGASGPAARMLAELEADPTWASDPAVAQARAHLLTIDRPEPLFYLEPKLRDALACHPRHRMAFEYLQTEYLLHRDTARLVGELHRLDDLGYPTMPTLYQEAALIEEVTGGRTADYGRYAISQETRDRLADFCRALGVDANDLAAVSRRCQGASDALRARFGATFFFYYVFNDSGYQR